ncbi:MAG: 3-oxoacyl-[acyl-carrier-protein] synthase III C-terminal domain-containing protein [Nanoarchaeota archaeon]
MGIRILGTGSALPERVITNKGLEGMVTNYDHKSGDFDTWAFGVTRIRERRFVGDKGSVTSLGVQAAKNALHMAGLQPSNVEFIVTSSSMLSGRDNTVPPLHQQIAYHLGAPNLTGMYVQDACRGFVTALDAAHDKSGRYKYILVVSSEVLSLHVDFADPKTAVLFSDGAGALVLSHEKNSYYDSHFAADASEGRFNAISYVEGGKIRMNGGPRVLPQAINALVNSSEVLLEKAKDYNIYPIDVEFVIPHQANGRITEGFAKRLQSPLKERVVNAIEKVGNNSSASIPIALDHLVRSEQLQLRDSDSARGSYVLTVGVGGSYVWGGNLFEV